MASKRAKFRMGQVVFGMGHYFRISDVIPCWDRDATPSDTKPDRFEYVDVWTHFKEGDLRPLTVRERGGRKRK